MNNNKRVSIITINLNNKVGLEQTISSIIKQDYLEIEYIIIDGYSNDGSTDIIKRYSDKISFWVSEKDDGIYQAMNKGIKKSTGDYLFFLNSGDVFYTNSALSTLVLQSSGEDLIYGNLIMKNSEIELIKHYPDKVSFNFFLQNSLPHPATLIKKSLIVSLGGYVEACKIVSDWYFFFKAICFENASYKHVSEIISVYNLDGISSQNAMYDLQIKEKQTLLYESIHFDYIQYLALLKNSEDLMFIRKSIAYKSLKFMRNLLTKNRN